MKPIEAMTIIEIRELKEKYRDEFITLVKNFLKERPMIDYIFLYEREYSGTGFGDSISLSFKDLRSINEVKLKGEKI